MNLSIALLLCGQLTFPDKIVCNVGQSLTIAPTDCKGVAVQYYALDPQVNAAGEVQYSLFPGGLFADQKITVVTGIKPGVYRVIAYTAVDNKATAPVELKIQVGSGVPPAPPAPVIPVPPAPSSDPIADEIKVAFDGVKAELDKKQSAAQIARFYRRANEKLADATTNSELWSALLKLSSETPLVGLKPVRELIGSKMQELLGLQTGAVISAEKRMTLQKLFTTAAATCEALSQ